MPTSVRRALGLVVAGFAACLACFATPRLHAQAMHEQSEDDQHGAARQFPKSRINPSTLPLIQAGLAGVTDYSDALPFCDLTKQARTWEKMAGNQLRGKLDPSLIGPDNYPTAIPEGAEEVASILFLSEFTKSPPGRYVLTWTSDQPTAGVRLDSMTDRGSLKLVEEDLASRVKRRVYDIPKGSKWLDLRVTDVTAREIHVWLPGMEGGHGEGAAKSMFTPWLKRSLEPAQVVRFMDWNATNNSLQREWADRPSLASDVFRWGNPRIFRHATPYEAMIDLANETGKEPWINVPHLATDDYVRQLARLVRDRLKPGLRVWIELSNECWNWGFQQTTHFKKIGAPEKLSHHQAYARRSQQCWDIFEQELGGLDRMVRVVAGAWGGNLKQFFQHPGFSPDVAAITTYIMGSDMKLEEAHASGKKNARFNDLHLIARDKGPSYPPALWADHYVNNIALSWKKSVATAASYGLPLVGYEGGSHMNLKPERIGDKEAVRFMFAVHADPKFYDAQLASLRAWKAAGGHGYSMFVAGGAWSKHGCWGHLRYYDEPLTTAHRFRAFVDFARENRR